MTTMNKPVNSVFVFPKGTSEKMKENKLNEKSYAKIKHQANLLRKCINKNKCVKQYINTEKI